MSASVATVLLEPNLLVREGLARVLSGTRFELRTHAATLKDLCYFKTDDPTLFVIAPPDGAINGAETVAQIRSEFPSAWIVLLSSSNDATRYAEAFRAGANAFLTKSLSVDVLLKSLELATLGVVVLPADVVKQLLGGWSDAQPFRVAYPEAQPRTVARGTPTPSWSPEIALSSREINILEALQKGSSNKLIARQYDIAEATVKVHVKAILRKIGASNRTQAAIWAMSHARPSSKSGSMPAQSELQ